MPKRVIIVHGWGNKAEDYWFPWLKKELEERGFSVVAPSLPQTKIPRIGNWIPALQAAVGTLDDQTFFVGHSLGCLAIARYLETAPEGVKAGGAVLVAGFFKRLTNVETDGFNMEAVAEWLETPLDLEKVKSHLGKSVAIFSDNDRYVPLDNQEEFRDRLGSKIIVEHAKGHFYEGDERYRQPVVLNALLEITQ